MQVHDDLNQALDDFAWWQAKFKPLDCIVTGWTYRNSAQVRLPSGAYISVGRDILELINCVERSAKADAA